MTAENVVYVRSERRFDIKVSHPLEKLQENFLQRILKCRNVEYTSNVKGERKAPKTERIGEVKMTANVETMFSVRETPWHGLGKVIQEAPTSEEALIVAGLDWEVLQTPVTLNGKVSDKHVINYRSDNGEILGVVSDRYMIVQNKEAFSFTDKLVSEGEVRYETAGSLKNGERVWMLARMAEDRTVLGDKVEPYLCFTNTHDGSGSVRVLMTPVRVVCQNTLNLAISQATRAWSAVHIGKNLDQKLHEAARTLELSIEYLDRLELEAETLQQIKVSESDWKGMVADLIPISKTASQKEINTKTEEQQALYSRLFVDDLSKFNESGWGVVNAVTDYLAHRSPRRTTETYQQRLFHKVVKGHPLLDKAYEMVGGLLVAA